MTSAHALARRPLRLLLMSRMHQARRANGLGSTPARLCDPRHYKRGSPHARPAPAPLAPGGRSAPGPPRERARFCAREVVRPLALQMMLAARGAGAELAIR